MLRDHPDRHGVALADSIKDLPDCHTWKRIGNSNDYENEYGWMTEVINVPQQSFLHGMRVEMDFKLKETGASDG